LLCVFLISGGLWAQQTSVAGTVTDESGLPLPGATIIVENTNRGVTTDFDGNYSIEAQAGEVLLVLACKKSDNSIDKVLENYGQGAVLRTIDQSGEFNYYAISSSSFTATIEAHDKEDGGLMQNVEIFVSADGGTEAKLQTLMPSDFQVGPTGLP